MLTKQSVILKKGSKVSKEAVKKITKKVVKTQPTKKGTSKKIVQKLPDHHFKIVKVW